MIKQTWNISSSEKERILRLHKSATQNQYLIKEQETEQPETDIQGKVKIVEDEFTFNFNFKSGHWSVNAESSAEDGTTIVDQVAGVITNLKNFLSQYLYPQITKIDIVSGESAVTNYDREIEGKNVELPKGELAKRRNDTLKKLFQTYLNDLINAGLIQKLPEFTEEVVQGTETEKGEAANLEQFVKVTISVRGVKKQVGCKLGVDIVVQYDKVPDTDPKFHRCNDAIFQLTLNNVPVGEEGDPDSRFNLNNFPHGQSVKKNLIISPTLAQRILGTMKNPEDENEPIIMRLICKTLGTCHDSPMLMTIFDKQGNVVGGPSYFGASDKGEDRMKANEYREIGSINKCGKILTVKDWFSDTKKEIEAAQSTEPK
jgi:hypothetical protein